MRWVYSDGGRPTGWPNKDCVCRAIAIATEEFYEVVYIELCALSLTEHITRRKPKRSDPSRGVYHVTGDRYMRQQPDWLWVPTMTIGSGCRVHLRASELPPGRLIVRVSKHWCAVIDGVIYDTHDPSRAGTRCVYGYWQKKVEDLI